MALVLIRIRVLGGIMCVWLLCSLSGCGVEPGATHFGMKGSTVKSRSDSLMTAPIMLWARAS